MIPNTVVLWASNAISVVLVVINTLCWGLTIRQVGAFELSVSFLLKLGVNPYFDLAMLSGLVGVVITYIGKASVGLGKASLFYGVGTVALILTSHLVFGERFDNYQLVGAVLAMAGSVLLLQ